MEILHNRQRSTSVNPLAMIDRIIADLELTPTQYKDATTSYQAVATALQKLHPGLSPSIHPQGSMRAGTTVRPQREERFDLDMICRLDMSGKLYTPEQVYALVWDALGKHETYRQMRRKRNCCIRLEYNPERKFYLDVTPAIPDWVRVGPLYVPDRERKEWSSSHPLAFCDGWFLKRGQVLPIIRPRVLARAYASKDAVLANEAFVEPMREYGQFEKTPLQRIVQMLKRNRDEFFKDRLTHRPSSILLTTIVTHSYSSLVGNPVESLLEFVVMVVVKLPEFIHVAGTPDSQKFFVINPVNEQENFAKDWTVDHYREFRIWHKQLASGLQNLLHKGQGMDVMFRSLSESFGNENVIKAATSLGADTSTLHEDGALRVNAGAIGSVGFTIPKTIYFGNGK